MSRFKVGGFAATVIAAAMISGTAYGAAGGNGAPGPAGNPNQPAAQPQANGPQGPAGNSAQGNSQSQPSQANSQGSQGKSNSSHGKSTTSHSKRATSHAKGGSSHGKSLSAPSRSNGSHANPTPGTPRSDNGNNGHAGKITICHATKSVKNPYVEITISVNGLNGHGPADDPRHHAGSWKDIIPAPAGGCPTTVQHPTPDVTNTSGTAGTQQPNTQQTNTQSGPTAAFRTTPGAQEVLGAQAHGTTPAKGAKGSGPASEVLGANASGTAPAAVMAANRAGSSHGSLPFTGLQLAIVLLAAAAALLGGYALRRATVGNRS